MEAKLESVKKYVILLLNSYSEIYFLKDYRLGFIIFICSFASWNVGVSGLIAGLAVLVIARFLFSPVDLYQDGHLLYNSILVGMSIGYIFDITIFSMFLILCASFLTYLLSVFLKGFLKHMGIPILSLPFCIISTLFYFSSKSFTTLFYRFTYETIFTHSLADYLPHYLSFFFKTLGAIIFNGDILVGIILSIAILLKSRIALWHMILGLALGHLFEHLIGSQSLYNTSFYGYSFNYMLIGVSVGGIFLVASYRTMLLLPFVLGIAVIITNGLNNILYLIDIPVFALPFNLTIIAVLYSLKYFQSWLLPVVHGSTPEETINLNFSYAFRSSKGLPSLNLPVHEEWSVYQGFDGEWTHQGKWRYALDFVKRGPDKLTYAKEGVFLEDYYTFGQTVYAPVRGYITALKQEEVDNYIGTVNTHLNWGNYLIIYADQGYYVILAHLKQNSLLAKVGDYVQINQALAQCGNSGYSPEPHLHMQVQYSPILGDDTTPFVLSAYIKDNQVYSFDIPGTGDLITAPPEQKGLINILTFILDDQLIFKVEDKVSKKVSELQLTVKMDRISGLFYFEDQAKNKLFFHKTEYFLYFDKFEGKKSYLKLLFSVIPRIPLFYTCGLSWKDRLPCHPRMNLFVKALLDFVAAHTGRAYSADMKLSFTEGLTIKSESYLGGEKEEAIVELDVVDIIKKVETSSVVMTRVRKS